MAESSRNKKISLTFLGLVLILWGLTDVRQRAHYDPALVAEDHAVLNKHRTDLTVFTEAGAAFFDGRNPYEVTNPRGWMYLYPPLFAILIAPLHALPPQWQGVVWYFCSLAMAWGCYQETKRLFHYSGAAEFVRGKDAEKTFRWIQAAVIVAILFPTLDCLQRGQVGILILYLLLLGTRLVLEGDSWRKTVPGGMVLALSIVFKIIPALPVFFLLFLLGMQRLRKSESLVRSFRFLEGGVGVIAGLFLFFWVMPALFVGWQTNTAHLKTWSQLIGNQAVETDTEAHFSNPRGPKNQSLSNALYHTGNQLVFWFSDNSEANPWLYNESEGRFMNSPAMTQGILGLRLALGLLLIPLAWRRSGSPLDRLAVWGLACAAMLILSPVARGHYFMLELPAVLFVSLWVWQHQGTRKALLCAGVPAVLSVAHYGFITFPQIFGPLQVGTLFLGTLGIGTALWYGILTCVLIAVSGQKTETDA